MNAQPLPGELLRNFRDSRDPPLTQEGLADILGVARNTVWRWESGDRPIDLDYIQVIAKTTGIAPALLRPDMASVLAKEPPQTVEPTESPAPSTPDGSESPPEGGAP